MAPWMGATHMPLINMLPAFFSIARINTRFSYFSPRQTQWINAIRRI